ncbi:hypothetical protein QBC38DRAFT_209622 [Podospora fimiseda]|uniref:Uncharacterized protein n=1 Tax=Podospora fimiseda TaxID=252190 RepID=A0AAN7BP90_9PEZI|nr:hypothetical protein QBC38DRAFT_209622 [Podospora fimiseda]
MVILGPLTTAYEFPASCSSVATQVFLVASATQQTNTAATRTLVQGPLFTDDPECFPKSYQPEPTNYYSPGFCPTGYTTACSSIETAKQETAVACCPEGNLKYTCGVNGNQVSLGCTTTWGGGGAALSIEAVIPGGSTTGFDAPTGGISAHGIHVRFRAGDPTAVSTSRPPPSATDPPPVVYVPTETGKKSSGLSSTAIIGIGVGAGLAFFIAVTSLCFFIYMRRKKRQSRDASDVYGPEPQIPREGPPPVPPKELSHTPVSYRAIPPPMYELSEEVSPRLPPSEFMKRANTASPASGMSSPVGTFNDRGESGVMYGVGVMVPIPPTPPVELEAEVPAEGSVDRRGAASPESGRSAWTENKQVSKQSFV